MTKPKYIHTQQDQGVTVLSFSPPLSSINEVSMRDLTEELLSMSLPAPALVLIDLHGVDFFGSSFIELLFRLWNRIKIGKGHFALCNVAPYCTDVLKVTNLDRLWMIYPDRAAGIAALLAGE